MVGLRLPTGRSVPRSRVTSGVTILMYHSISSAVDPYTVSPQVFRRQIDFIASTYPIVRLREITGHVVNDDDRKVVITFDDAFGDFFESAFPVLAERAIPSTLFVPTAHLGGWNSWDRDTPKMARKRIMHTSEIRRLCETGMVDLGSHTVDHRSMRRLPKEQMHTQAVASRAFLEDTFGAPIDMFSYPYGQRDDFSSLTSKVLAEAGYDIAVTTCWGTRNSLGDLLKLRRISLTEHDDLRTIRGKIEGQYDWIGLKETMGYAWRSGLKTLRHREDGRQ